MIESEKEWEEFVEKVLTADEDGKLTKAVENFSSFISDEMVHEQIKKSGVLYYPTSDPFENYKNLQESTAMKVDLADVAAANRTLVIVYGSKESPNDFKERANRLVSSLNMPETIKVVVITINGDNVYSGLDFKNPASSGSVDQELLEEVKSRFVQVVEVRHGEH